MVITNPIKAKKKVKENRIKTSDSTYFFTPIFKSNPGIIKKQKKSKIQTMKPTNLPLEKIDIIMRIIIKTSKNKPKIIITKPVSLSLIILLDFNPSIGLIR